MAGVCVIAVISFQFAQRQRSVYRSFLIYVAFDDVQSVL